MTWKIKKKTESLTNVNKWNKIWNIRQLPMAYCLFSKYVICQLSFKVMTLKWCRRLWSQLIDTEQVSAIAEEDDFFSVTEEMIMILP